MLTNAHCVKRNTVVSASFEYKGKLYDLQIHTKGFFKKLFKLTRIVISDESDEPFELKDPRRGLEEVEEKKVTG